MPDPRDTAGGRIAVAAPPDTPPGAPLPGGLPNWRQRAGRWLERHSLPALTALAILVLILVAARAALPWFLKREVNERLAKIPGYAGHVDDVGVQLWHGGYSMNHFIVRKRDGRVEKPLFWADEIDFSIAYRELLRGKFVSQVVVRGAELNFVHGATAASSQSGKEARWQDVITDLFPIDIMNFQVIDGRIHYVDTASNPQVDVWLEHVQADLTGLRNRPSRKEGALPAGLIAQADTIGHGKLRLFVAAEPLAAQPHFELRARLQGVQLSSLNNFLLAYTGIDVSRGTFEVYSEVDAQGGSYRGYVKPFLRDMHFGTRSDAGKPLPQRLWKDIVSGIEKLLRDKPQGELATVVPFDGKFEGSTAVEKWAAFKTMLRHGFVKALTHRYNGLDAAEKSSSKEKPAAPAI